jgi:hypothetical protein
MTHAALASLLGPEFDDFLYASIDGDKNGKPLSVLSALAGLDIDPWGEAANLARLPKETATQRLAALIAELPDGPSAHRPAETIAARLIALLPRGGASSFVPPHQTSPGAGSMTYPRPIAYAIFLILMLSVFCSLLSRGSPTPINDAHPPAPVAAGEVSSPALH